MIQFRSHSNMAVRGGRSDNKLDGKLLGILDANRLREDVPRKLAECRQHLTDE